MKISDIENEIIVGQVNPNRLAELRAILSGIYSSTSGELEQILEIKATKWLDMRKAMKSDASTDKLWDSLPEGISEMKLRMRLKRIEKMIGGIKSLLEVAMGNARNQF